MAAFAALFLLVHNGSVRMMTGARMLLFSMRCGSPNHGRGNIWVKNRIVRVARHAVGGWGTACSAFRRLRGGDKSLLRRCPSDWSTDPACGQGWRKSDWLALFLFH